MLHIALQDGFDNDLVLVHINDKEVLRKEMVRTDPRISLAHAFEIAFSNTTVRLEVKLPEKGMSESITVDVSEMVYVKVSVFGGAIYISTHDHPFGYV